MAYTEEMRSESAEKAGTAALTRDTVERKEVHGTSEVGKAVGE